MEMYVPSDEVPRFSYQLRLQHQNKNKMYKIYKVRLITKQNNRRIAIVSA